MDKFKIFIQILLFFLLITIIGLNFENSKKNNGDNIRFNDNGKELIQKNYENIEFEYQLLKFNDLNINNNIIINNITDFEELNLNIEIDKDYFDNNSIIIIPNINLNNITFKILEIKEYENEIKVIIDKELKEIYEINADDYIAIIKLYNINNEKEISIFYK